MELEQIETLQKAIDKDEREEREGAGRIWNHEFHTQAFLSGLDRAIEITGKHNRESGFLVSYYKGVFSYPDFIQIGQERSVYLAEYVHDPVRLKLFKQETGKVAPGTFGFKRLSSRQKRKRNDEYLSWIEEKNANEKTAFKVDYPRTKDWCMRKSLRGKIYSDEIDAQLENVQTPDIAFSVHTHPPEDNLITPSPRDLESLFDERFSNSSRARGVNPITVIAGTRQYGRAGTPKFPLLLFQERSDFPLKEEDWDKLALGFKSLVDVPKTYDFSEQEIAVLERYMFMKLRYVSMRERLIEDRGSWSDFSAPRDAVPIPEEKSREMKLLSFNYSLKRAPQYSNRDEGKY